MRLTNPYNSILDKSTIFADISGVDTSNVDPTLIEKFTLRGGKMSSSKDSGNSTTKFSINHGEIDGFGLLQLIRPSISASAFLNASASRNGQVNGFSFTHLTRERSDRSYAGKTFTQMFLKVLIDQFRDLIGDRIGFVVNLEPPAQTKPPWGNGIAIIYPRTSEIERACIDETPRWKQYLVERAKRTLSILSRRPSDALPMDSIVVSSIGMISGKGEFGPVRAETLVLAATPIYPSSANLFLYCDSKTQSLVICGKPEHWLFSNIDRIKEIWENLC